VPGREPTEFGAAGRVPQADGGRPPPIAGVTTPPAGGQGLAVGGEGQGIDPPHQPGANPSDLPAGGHLPQEDLPLPLLQGLIQGPADPEDDSGRQPPAVGGEGDRRAVVPGPGSHLPESSGGHVPHPDAVDRRQGQGPAVGGEGQPDPGILDDGAHDVRIRGTLPPRDIEELAEPFARGRPPEGHGQRPAPLAHGRGHRLAVGGEGEGPAPVRARLQPEQVLARARLPQVDGAPRPAQRGQAPAIGGEGQLLGLQEQPRQAADLPAGGRLPQADPVDLAARREELAVGGEGHDGHRAPVAKAHRTQAGDRPRR
jgi:hypothetical protein